MIVSTSEQSEELGLEVARGSTAVCIPLTGRTELFHQCVRRVLAHTSEAVPILVAGDEQADPAVDRFLSELPRDVHYIRSNGVPGPVGLANVLLTACAPANAVLLASQALVFEGWLERLQEASSSDAAVATVSAFGEDAGGLSLLSRDEALSANADIDRLAAQIAKLSPKARPRTPTADGYCTWVSRAALDLVGPLDTAFGSLRAAVIDFSQRCLLRGLANIVADDVWVLPARSALGGSSALEAGDWPLIERRYPYLSETLEADETWPALRRSVSVARRALLGLSVTIDARIVRGSPSGPHIQTLQLVDALSRTEQIAIRFVLDPAIDQQMLALLDRMPGVERLFADEVGTDTRRTTLVHRPYQVSSPDDLDLLRSLGERLVITHLDLIAFHNPGYLASFAAWRQYRRVTRQALTMADLVIFLSEHALEDAVREGLVDRPRARLIPMVVTGDTVGEQRRPAGAPDGDFLLCIGNDFQHKNRVFAFELLEELLDRDWEGGLVLAGAHIGEGSSAGDEAAFLASRPEIAAAIRELPALDEPEKAWLYANAVAVVYPTVQEGFGLIPFEAAKAGIPCLFAPQASLADILPHEAALLVPWDAAASAERVLPVLHDSPERRRQVQLVIDAAARMDGVESIQSALVETYEAAIRLPFREASVLATEATVREAELAKWVDFEANMGDLVGPDAYFPPGVQRALLAIATRRWLRRPLFALVVALYRVGYRVRRTARANGD
jgi:hypothetical protein